MFLYRDRLEMVTPEAVQAVARKYLPRNNRTVGMFIPAEKSERVSVPPTPALAEMIGDYKGREALAMGEAFDVSPQNVEERTTRTQLASGLKVALLPKKTRGNSVQMRLTLRYGSAESLKGLTIAADVLPTLMLRGTKQLDRQQIQDVMDKNKSRIAASGSTGQATFSIESRKENLPAMIELLRQVLREPTLPVAELDIIRNRNLAQLQQQLTEPQALAQRAVQKVLSPYPVDDVRYQPSMQESIELWKKVNRDDIVRLHRDFLNGQHGELSLVGDFESESIKPLLETLTRGWSSKESFERISRTGDVQLKASREQIETPDKDNAMYFAGSVFPMNDSDPDYAPLTIGNFILGSSGLSSRLGDRVRQKEGLSYGVASNFQANSLDNRSIFYIYAITNPANMPKVESAISEEIDLLLRNGVTTQELSEAINGYLENQKVNRSDDSQLASTLNSTLEVGRDMSYYGKLESRIANLKADVVLTALRKRIDPERIVVVEAGDFAKAAKDSRLPATGVKPVNKD
jgi:zinc protease